jgi:hypothetical protein
MGRNDLINIIQGRKFRDNNESMHPSFLAIDQARKAQKHVFQCYDKEISTINVPNVAFQHEEAFQIR